MAANNLRELLVEELASVHLDLDECAESIQYQSFNAKLNAFDAARTISAYIQRDESFAVRMIDDGARREKTARLWISNSASAGVPDLCDYDRFIFDGYNWQPRGQHRTVQNGAIAVDVVRIEYREKSTSSMTLRRP